MCARVLPFGHIGAHVPGSPPSHGVAHIKACDETNVGRNGLGTQPMWVPCLDLSEEPECKGKCTAPDVKLRLTSHEDFP